MSGLPIQIDLPDEVLEQLAQRVATILAEQSSDDPLYTVDEAAEYLRATKSRIYDLTSSRRLRVHKDGTRSLYRRSDLNAVLEPTKGR